MTSRMFVGPGRATRFAAPGGTYFFAAVSVPRSIAAVATAE